MFEVDAAGLRKLAERNGTERVVLELISNALDEPGVTAVFVSLEPVPGRDRVIVTVEDDAPEGFVNLRDAWTLFGDTRKRGNVETRGRFNLGEKLVIAACDKAQITTTTGCVIFEDNKRRSSRLRTQVGSVFTGTLRMTREAMRDALILIRRILVPAGIALRVNGDLVTPSLARTAFTALLQTEVADEEGVLRRVSRTTTVGVHRVGEHETAYLYEMGIPVRDVSGEWSFDVHQKVPLNMDRDNVPPAYLRRLRTLALNQLAVTGEVTQSVAAEPWVKRSLEDPEVVSQAVAAVVTALYGDKVVTRDPSDPEATNRCIAAGYRVLEPGTYSGAAWANIRASQVAPPAGKVMPTRPPATAPSVPVTELTDGMKAYRNLCQRLAWELLTTSVCVEFYDAPMASTLATWQTFHAKSSQLRLNVGRLGVAWFERGICEDVLDLFLHEAAHEYESNHLSSGYHDACTKLGAKLAIAVRNDPTLLRWEA